MMHVAAVPIDDALAKKVPWLQSVQVTATATAGGAPPGVHEAKERARQHEEDRAEATERRIKGSVGDGVGEGDDVVWVRKRLIRFGFLGASATAAADAALGEAITAFQKSHVYPRRPAKADGVVSRKGRTVRILRRTRRALGLDAAPAGAKKIDPLFLALTQERGVNGMVNVISGLGVRVRAGEALWLSGAAASFSEQGFRQLREQVHWEVFSAHKLFGDKQAGWDSIEDPDEDLTVDAPRTLVDLVEHGTFRGTLPFADTPQGLVPLEELTQFYRSPKAAVLRRRQCKFRTEWGLDIDTTIDRLIKQRGWFDVERLRTDLVPYQWWHDAADRLPDDGSGSPQTHVWHYNPIEFTLAYQEALAAVQPSERKDHNEFSDVEVSVFNRHGTGLGRATVELRGTGEDPRSKKTASPNRRGEGGGVVDFYDVPKGPCTVLVSFADKDQAWSSDPIEFVVVAPQDVNTVTVDTPLEGPLPPTGSLRIHVRKGGQQHRDPVAINVTDGSGVVVFAGESSGGNLDVPGLRFGDYTVRSQDGESDPVEAQIKAKRRHRAHLHRYLGKAPLHVHVSYEGTPAEDVLVVAKYNKNGAPVTDGTGTTGVDGVCVLDIREGWYKVRAGKTTAKVRAVAGETTRVELELKEPPAEPEPQGFLMVEVRLESGVSNEVATGNVLLSTPEDPDFVRMTVALNPSGRALFKTTPGTYLVRYKTAEAEVTLGVGSTQSVTLTP